MTQLGHAQTEADARANTTARTAIWITVWSIVAALALFCAVGEAIAETYTPHARRITSRYTTAHFVGHRTSARARATGVRTGRTTAHAVPVERGPRSLDRSSRFEPVRESASSRRTSNSDKHSARGTQPASPSMHRVSGSRRRRGERRTGDDRMEVVAGTNGAYAEGVAHPNENASLSASATSRSALPQVTASADASSASHEPARLQSSDPSDPTGAPMAAAAAGLQATTTDGDTALHSATREELAEEAGQPEVLPGLYRYGRLVVPPPMRGTREILMHQNLVADEEGLSRIQDDDDLRRMRAERMLVDFPESMSLHVNPELAGDRRCARPWTVRFAADIAHEYYVRFHQPLQINSAVRTVAYQLRLRRVNGNAAGIGGDMASPHLTGEALDFGKRDMSAEEIAWMRTYLRPLMQVGKLDVEEEFQQACFHISVYRSYAPEMLSSRHEYAQLHGPHAARVHADVDQ